MENQNMQIPGSDQVVGSEWLSTKEASKIWGNNRHNMSQLIVKYMPQLGDNAKYVVGRGKGGRQLRVTKKGLDLLRAMAGNRQSQYNGRDVLAFKKEITEDFLSLHFELPVFAKQIGATLASVRKWLDRHPDFKVEHCKFDMFGMKGFDYITKVGAAKFIAIKGNYADNLSDRKNRLPELKEGMAEVALSKIQPVQTDPLLGAIEAMMQMRRDQLAQAKDVAAVKDGLLAVNAKVDRLTLTIEGEKFLTKAQRDRLNERVRYLANHVQKETNNFHAYSQTWHKLHDYIGRPNLSEYLFEDYAKSIEYLKLLYSEYSLNW